MASATSPAVSPRMIVTEFKWLQRVVKLWSLMVPQRMYDRRTKKNEHALGCDEQARRSRGDAGEAFELTVSPSRSE